MDESVEDTQPAAAHSKIRDEEPLSADQPAESGTTPVEERDVWWGSYSIRRAIPLMAAAGLASLVFIAITVYLVTQRDWPPITGRTTNYIVLGIFWLSLLGRCVYRTIGYTYRLTTHRLFYYWGLLHPLPPPILLKDVHEVIVEQTFLESWLYVGKIRIETEAGKPPLILPGVADPYQVAEEISHHVHLAHGEDDSRITGARRKPNA